MKTYLMCGAVVGVLSIGAGTASAQHGHAPIHHHAPHRAVHHQPVHHHQTFASPHTYPGNYYSAAPYVIASPRIVIASGYSLPAVGFGGSVGYGSPYGGYVAPVRGIGHGFSFGGIGHHHHR